MKILLLANLSLGLYKFRKELLQELIKQNHEVYVSVPKDEHVSLLESLGCNFIETNVDRRGTNPISDIQLLFFYIRIINRIKPDAVLTYTIKPNVYGGIACNVTNTAYIANVTGLGTSIEEKGIIQKITLALYRIGLKKAACVFFQNETNRQFFLRQRLVKGKTKLIPGSGVNLMEFRFEDYPQHDQVIRFLFIGRIMKAKGIEELLEVIPRIKARYNQVQFDLLGPCEEDYTDQLSDFERRGLIKYHGQQTDVLSFIKNSHATILPSYHEGTANVLLESAAVGRPVLASKVAGCKETFEEGLSGLGFEVRDAHSLEETLIRFVNLPYEEKKAMGVAGRRKMEKDYDRSIVVGEYIEEIDQSTRRLREK
ncbi:glycosyltransferase family 4 protein [Heliobacterium chlorum]|uniref:Glycosyltransferase family 4 protein n=1 Tax=Heliobacterium chlorum TaxID=2698 RepID=A0ABR7T4X6_HELCL|nr:glycosyltransferase family 4 protein [Heliobacterium chlorum]MBC9785837.1 glycosyltransferase family 4 protein [Heliobacterium chlorum]